MDKLVGKYTIVPWILWWVMKIFPQPRFPWNEGTALTKPPFNELSGFVFQVFLGDFLGSPCVVLFLLLFQHLHLKSTGVFSTSAVQKWGKKSGETLKRSENIQNFHDSKNYGTMISNSKFQQIIPGMICHLIQVCYDDWKKNLRNKMRQLLNKVSVFDAGIVCNMHVLRIHEAFSC